ncbi:MULTISPECIES: regulatory signaling modulator protein AmpE [Pseudomonas]|uniref:regulatory signaling modulator protein AmpE n=1 Tax=Pseudomonas TaxID=286 RepID=UPI00235E02BB|nr:regulatory signaling modulator protein AmpE [Pseudomonas asplenii]
MSFLVLLLAVWIEKFSALRQRVQRDGAWLAELARLESSPRWAKRPWVILSLLVLLPVVLLGLLLMVLQPVAYGLLALPVHLLVVVYSLGRGDLLAALGPFRDAWRRGDLQAGVHVARRDMNLTCAENGEELLEKVQGYLLWQAYQSFFAVIFWYFLLGPVAALSYRLLALAAEHSQNPALAERATLLRHAFDWLPVRLLAASLALVGNFVAVSRIMLHELLNWDISARQLIEKVGRVAGEVPTSAEGPDGVSSLDSLWELLLRAAVLWYAGFALWTVLIR